MTYERQLIFRKYVDTLTNGSCNIDLNRKTPKNDRGHCLFLINIKIQKT